MQHMSPLADALRMKGGVRKAMGETIKDGAHEAPPPELPAVRLRPEALLPLAFAVDAEPG